MAKPSTQENRLRLRSTAGAQPRAAKQGVWLKLGRKLRAKQLHKARACKQVTREALLKQGTSPDT
eukprot:948612-Amphidinium_carterae.1